MDVGTINKWYADGKGYFTYMGFLKLWPKCERFIAGDQWPPITALTKNKPRPVIDITEPIVNHKVASIINDPIKMVFSPDDQDEQDPMAEVGAEIFTRYAEVEWDNVDQDELNEDALRNAAIKGPGIWHYYWDDTAIVGKKRIAKGKLCSETLDGINVFVGNPQDTKTQTQPYILITSRKDVDDIKVEARANGVSEVDIAQIVGDKNTTDEGYDASQKEIKDKATVITAYWKEKGTVQLMKVCGLITIKPQVDTKHKLYPIAKMNWYKRNKSWYGQGEVEKLINYQKSINTMVAMQMQSAVDTGMPKPMVKPGVQGWNNDTGKAIIDGSGATGWGVSYLQPSPISAEVPNLVEFLLTNAKSNAGASETSTGDVSTMSNLSPTVVMALQQQAQMPVETIKTRFKRTLKEIGEILSEFWTINYTTTRVMMVKKLAPVLDPITKQPMLDQNGQPMTQETEQPQNFKGTDFKDISLKLKIDIGTSKAFSDTLVMSSLDKLYDTKAIPPKLYIEMAPETIMPFKNELLKKMEQQPQPNMLPSTPQM